MVALGVFGLLNYCTSSSDCTPKLFSEEDNMNRNRNLEQGFFLKFDGFLWFATLQDVKINHQKGNQNNPIDLQ